jgi:hypothetical protein
MVTVTARSRTDPSKAFAQAGPVRTLDLTRLIKEMTARDLGGLGASREEPSIESLVEFIDGQRVPELYLEASVIANFVARQAGFDLRFRKVSKAPHVQRTVPAIRVEFVIRGLGFDPASLTEQIGVEPDRVNRADHARFPRSLDTWTYGGQIVRADTFAPMLEPLLVTLTAKAGPIRDFCRENDAEARVGFVAEFVDAPPQLSLSASDFARIADLGASVWYDVYQRERLD